MGQGHAQNWYLNYSASKISGCTVCDTTLAAPHPGEQIRGSQPLRAAATTVTYGTQIVLRWLEAELSRTSGSWSYTKDSRAIRCEETGKCSSEMGELKSG